MPLPLGWLAAVLGGLLALAAELITGLVLLIRSRRRRRRAPVPGGSWAQPPAGYAP